MRASAASARYRPEAVNREFAQAVADGLTRKGQKTLPASWLYDEVGSALFEVITLLPEYGLTRADAGLLSRAAGEIVNTAGQPRLIVELGSGTGSKTRHILAAAAHDTRIEYRPIDISAAALDGCVKVLSGIQRVKIQPIEATYHDGIDIALANRKPGEHALLLFLGSTIGNFNRSEAGVFLGRIRKRMQPDDHLLLGADLVKSRSRLLSAYDDPAGVTAAFNLNILGRINRELDGRFDLKQFAHEARYNERQARIEMHLRSRIDQQIHIGELDVTVSFSSGESIWTESSHKFRADEIAALGERAGWACVRQWIDAEWGFAETLFGTSRGS